ncbi:amidase [Pseudomarimonas arenosa]|uniref:Amidase n=1 Tax=Pseudomarimonas arenosa TaxID=2774145 RepID=A0AAW3ZH82_9GAMM|nr:amidase [Pseudomarimonas arenosa]MBD8524619.1 amidase [Pseudomarimonas arenosa]
MGVPMNSAERELMLDAVREQRAAFDALHGFDLPNDLAPALVFTPGFSPPAVSLTPGWSQPDDIQRPANNDELPFLSVAELGVLLRSGQLTSVELTTICLDRIRRYDAELHALITVTEPLALQQAKQADAEFAAGIDRGPLQGIPYGLKDLFAVEGYPTTWGAMPYKNQRIESNATVVQRLQAAGAVLIAKSSVGALAWGDVWYGGKTRTPWNPEQGTSGSSAGSAAGVAAGFFPFAIGTETWGSIVSPSLKSGVTGLRPTFGRVSRSGAMALAWSMDKVGPICRYAEDCAMVLDAIRGPDGKDLSVQPAGFAYDPQLAIADLKLAYLKQDFESPYDNEDEQAGRLAQQNDQRLLAALQASGVKLQAVSLPEFPADALAFILSAEAAAAFDTLTRSGQDDTMVRQIKHAWPNVFRAARFIPAVEYLQANRLRLRLVQQINRMLADFDVVFSPCWANDQSLITNLTGHPSIFVPHGIGANNLPTGICLIANAFDEGRLITAARSLQQLNTFHHQRPPGFAP